MKRSASGARGAHIGGGRGPRQARTGVSPKSKTPALGIFALYSGEKFDSPAILEARYSGNSVGARDGRRE
jgi:hypothetical protein